MEDKNKKIAVMALIFALLVLSQAQAITSTAMNLIGLRSQKEIVSRWMSQEDLLCRG